MDRASGSPRATVHLVGSEQEPVIVIDDVTGRGEALVDYAATRTRFAPAATVDSHYPGLLAPASRDYLDAVVRFVLPLIARHFGTGPLRPARARGNFSLVTTPPGALVPLQRVPHVDSVNPLQFAAVHFLCDPAHGGTGFFRHRATGFETIDATRAAPYQETLAAELEQEPEGKRTRYPGDADDPLFARTAESEAAFDRLVLYRASLLHAGLIPEPPSHADDPRQGRLTGNLFLQCTAAA